MSWASKAHKKYQVEKLVKEVLRNPEYKKMQQQEDLKCFSCLALISVDFMMRKHGYSKKRILEYVEFLKRQLSYVNHYDCLETDVREEARKNFNRQPYKSVDAAKYIAKKFGIGGDADGQGANQKGK